MSDTLPNEVPAVETDEEILAELLERTSYMMEKWSEIRAQGDLNMKALSIVGPWPEAELAARQDPTKGLRPHGHTDIISQYNNRVVNQWRINPRGVKIDASGEGADKKTAELREGRIREIAYASQAKAARLCCLQNVVDRGYGVFEVYSEYESPRTSKQRICVGAIQNPNSVLIDPDTAKPDRSDMRYALKMGRKMTKAEFKRKYPKARDLSSFPSEAIGLAKQFTDGQTVTPAEYFRVVTKERVLLTLDDGSEVFEDELADAAGRVEVKRRESETAEVQHFVTNGLQILSRKTLLGSTIPLIFVVAREKYEQDVLTVEALTSKMREPQLNFDVVRASQIEAVNQVPKSKWAVSDEAIAGYEDIWKNAHRDPTAYLPYHAYDKFGRPVQPPERTDYDPPVDRLELLAGSFVRDAQNTVGMASVERKDRTAKSNVALETLNQDADIASYHIVDNMLMGIEYEGRIENEWLALIEDSERTVGLRKPDGKYVTEKITPMGVEGGQIQHPYGDASSHAVTVGTGPDYASQRAEKVDFLKDLAKTPEAIANPMMPLIIHEMELGPGGDKMEKIALAVQPPAVQAAYAEGGEEGQGEEMPPQAVAAIQQKEQELTALNEHAKGLEQKVIELEDDLRAQKIKAESDERISAEDNATTIEKARIDAETKVMLQRMKEEHELRMAQFEIKLKEIDLERERIRGSISLESQGRQQMHESTENREDRRVAEQKATEGGGE